MNILLWNVEFATTNSERGRCIISIIEDTKPIICMIEGYIVTGDYKINPKK